MSPSTDNFIHSLVEMSKAFEELPKVQAALYRMQEAAIIDGNTIAEREATILRLKAEIDDLHTKIRDAEVAKDAAETMFLEADDRTSRALDFIKATFGNAGALIQALEPPRVELAVEAEAKPSTEQVAWESPNPIVPLPEAAPEPSPTGQSALGEPDAPLMEDISAFTPTGLGMEPVPPEASAIGPNAAPNTELRGRYQGEYYHKFPQYISLADWLAGGGNEYSYYYRP